MARVLVEVGQSVDAHTVVVEFDFSPDTSTVIEDPAPTVAVTVAAGTFVQFPASLLPGVRFLKLVSNASESGGDSLYLVSRAG